MPSDKLAGPDSWEAQEDMRTLLRAAAIRRDPARMKRARAAARKKLQEQNAETAQMRELAQGKK